MILFVPNRLKVLQILQRLSSILYAFCTRYPNWSHLARPEDAKRYVRGSGDGEGTVAVKGRVVTLRSAGSAGKEREKLRFF